jgi:HPt (histidine-containing phosphotransfer) domain-containing protein
VVDPIAEAVARFRAKLPARIDEIEAAWRSGDGARAEAAAHKLAGAGATFGLPVASEIARRLETAFSSGGGDSGAIARDIAALRELTEG